MTAKISKEEMLEAIANLTVLELSDLVKAIEEKFDVKAAPAMGAIAVAAAPAAGGAPAAEKTTSTVMITGLSDDSKKISVIKVVREITGLGLKEAKDMVEGAPKAVKENVPNAEAEDMKKKLVEAGAKIDLK